MHYKDVVVDEIYLSVLLQSPAFKGFADDQAHLIKKVIKEVKNHSSKFRNVEFSLVLCNDDYIWQFNKMYRGKDKATNVLSFPAGGEWFEHLLNEDFLGERQIGDILLSVETLQKEAKEQSKAIEHHFAHLFLHGILHLLGYDHVESEEAEEMEALEIKILAALGISNPYP